MIAMGAVAIVMLFVEIEGIHIDAKGQGWPGPPGVERGHHAGETTFKTPAASAPARPVRGRVRKPGPGSPHPAAPSGCRHR